MLLTESSAPACKPEFYFSKLSPGKTSLKFILNPRTNEAKYSPFELNNEKELGYQEEKRNETLNKEGMTSYDKSLILNICPKRLIFVFLEMKLNLIHGNCKDLVYCHLRVNQLKSVVMGQDSCRSLMSSKYHLVQWVTKVWMSVCCYCCYFFP